MPCFASWPRRRTPPIPRSSSRPRPSRSATTSGVSFAPRVTAGSRDTASGRSRTCFATSKSCPRMTSRPICTARAEWSECSNVKSRTCSANRPRHSCRAGSWRSRSRSGFTPTGADRHVVAFHPTCHLEMHEDKAYQRLHGLVGLTVGDARGLHDPRRPRGSEGAAGGSAHRAPAARDRRPVAGVGRPRRAGRPCPRPRCRRSP